MDALRQVEDWPAGHVAVGVVTFEGDIVTHGDVDRSYGWASVTKLLTTYAVLDACETEGLIDLDEPAGPEGSTVRHLLAHASGLAPDEPTPIAKPGTRRIYSNAGFELLAALVSERAEVEFSSYLEMVLNRFPYYGTGGPWPGGALEGSAASGYVGPLSSLLVLARELLNPAWLSDRLIMDEASSVQFPGLVGVLPGFGRQEPNDWGLGFEIRDAKSPHWSGSRNSPRTFGHFGASGTFLWVDPEAELALACLTDLDFGDWAVEAWPRLADSVLTEARG